MIHLKSISAIIFQFRLQKVKCKHPFFKLKLQCNLMLPSFDRFSASEFEANLFSNSFVESCVAHRCVHGAGAGIAIAAGITDGAVVRAVTVVGVAAGGVTAADAGSTMATEAASEV